MVTHPMPSEVQVDAMGDHARYLLPRRRLGGVHWLGVVPIVFGLLAIGFLSNLIGPAWRQWLDGGRGNRIFAGFMLAFALLFALPMLRIVLLGLVVLMGRTEIRLVNGRLSTRERVGPFTYTRLFKKKTPIQRVSVGYGDGVALINGRPTDKFKALANMAAVGVEAGPELKDRFLLTIGYPKEMLLPIGQDLADRLHVPFREGPMKAGDWFEPETDEASRKSVESNS